MKYHLLFACLFLMAFNASAQKSTTGNANQQADEPPTAPPSIYTYVDQMPEPPFDIGRYLGENIIYPAKAKRDNVQGRIVLKFVVNADGSVTDVRVTRGISKECDEEAIRVVKNMPSWKPGKQNGKPVRVFFTLPLIFKLTDPPQK